MDIESLPLWLRIGVYLVIAFFAVVIFIIGFSALTRPLINEGSSSVGNFTDNASFYQGFGASFTAAPLLIWIIFGGLICYGIWALVRRVRLPGHER